MTLKPDDMIDERKNYKESCGLVVKVTKGGAGFQNLKCCGYTLGEEDKVTEIADTGNRPEGPKIKKGTIIDENKNYPNSCGLVMEVLAGGAGFQEINCCGNKLTEKDIA